MPIGAFKLNSIGRYLAPTGRTALTLVSNGNVQVTTAQKQFGTGSATFDGNSDFINISSALPTLTGDLTIELWARFAILPTSQTLGGGAYMMVFAPNTSAEPYWMVRNSGASNNPNFQIAIPGGGGKYGDFTLTGTSIATNTWYHMAITRASGTWKCWWNGTDMGAATDTFQWTTRTGTEDMMPYRFGQFIDSRGSWQGQMDEIRVSNIARYSTAFTPPTSSFANDSNTVLLIHADGTNASTTFTDDTTTTNRTAVTFSRQGTAQISTAQSKFGGSSLYLDGSSSNLNMSPTGIGLSKSDNFTLEAFVRLNALPGTNLFAMVFGDTNGEAYASIANRSGTYVSNIVVRDTDGVTFREEYKTISSLATNTWYHWAIVKSGNTLKHFWNGTELTTLYSSQGTMTSTMGFSTLFQIGTWGSSFGSFWNGYLDEIRVSNIARYTANFTAPTARFVNDSNTLVLIHADGTNGSTTFTDDNG